MGDTNKTIENEPGSWGVYMERRQASSCPNIVSGRRMSEEYGIACEGSMNLRIGEIASAFKPMHDRNEVSEEGLVGIIRVVIGSCRLCNRICLFSYPFHCYSKGCYRIS